VKGVLLSPNGIVTIIFGKIIRSSAKKVILLVVMDYDDDHHHHHSLPPRVLLLILHRKHQLLELEDVMLCHSTPHPVHLTAAAAASSKHRSPSSLARAPRLHQRSQQQHRS
jgi:hypothetical protein